MANCVVLKRKHHVTTLVATNVSMKRARIIATHPHDKYATYLIAEVVETIPVNIPKNLPKDENRTSV